MRTPRFSLRFRIGVYYALIASSLLPIAYLLYKTYREGARAQLAEGAQLVQAACSDLQQKFVAAARSQAFAHAGEAKFQDALLEIILERYDGVEGGFWRAGSGFAGYAFPTYDGTSPKRDVPPSEQGGLAELARAAIAQGRPQTKLRRGRREAVYGYACPVAEASEPTAAWVLTRIPISSGAEFDRLKWAVLALLLIVGLAGAGSATLLRGWSRDLNKLRRSISGHSVEELPDLPASPEPDLQVIVEAFNELNHRLRRTRADGADLTRKLAQAERLTWLGRMAAGIAHEIRNPMATLRIKLENAAVFPAERLPRALPVLVEQIARVDRLVQMLLSVSQPFSLRAVEVNLPDWIEHALAGVAPPASAKGVRLNFSSAVAVWNFDPFHLARALENILLNAVAFSPPAGEVRVTANEEGGLLVIEVRDEGPGLTPGQRETLFQPFASSRPSGTGLGLVLAKEVVEAHGGRLREVSASGGACFRLEVPWQKS